MSSAENLKNNITNLLKENLVFPDSNNLQQRGIADKIESACNLILTENLPDVRPATSRRSIEDVNIGNVYVDHKTSDAALDFKMPNMISIDRLRKLDRDLIYNFVIYDSKQKVILDNFSLFVYELNWDYLKIQNLGKGQLQITSMSDFVKSPKTNLTKQQWYDRLKTEAINFYDKVQKDAGKRKAEWQAK